jgi:CHASE2 domain-containing sensor protein
VGLITIVVLSLGTDQLFHVLEVYPPWGQPMNDAGDNLLALAYRCVYGVFGSYIAARLAPYAPMRHAMILGAIGLVLSTLGAVAATSMNLGPIWYPIALVLTALPCAWLGGSLYLKRRR